MSKFSDLDVQFWTAVEHLDADIAEWHREQEELEDALRHAPCRECGQFHHE